MEFIIYWLKITSRMKIICSDLTIAQHFWDGHWLHQNTTKTGFWELDLLKPENWLDSLLVSQFICILSKRIRERWLRSTFCVLIRSWDTIDLPLCWSRKSLEELTEKISGKPSTLLELLFQPQLPRQDTTTDLLTHWNWLTSISPVLVETRPELELSSSTDSQKRPISKDFVPWKNRILELSINSSIIISLNSNFTRSSLRPKLSISCFLERRLFIPMLLRLINRLLISSPSIIFPQLLSESQNTINSRPSILTITFQLLPHFKSWWKMPWLLLNKMISMSSMLLISCTILNSSENSNSPQVMEISIIISITGD